MLPCPRTYCGGQLLPALPPSGGAWPATGASVALECSLCAREYEWSRATRQPMPLRPLPSDPAVTDSPTEEAVAAAIVATYRAQQAAQQPELSLL